MSIEIKMPALSPTMVDGKLVEWKFNKGDKIQSGDVLFTVETDKAVMEFEVAYEGVLGDILIGNNTEKVAVGTTVGWIFENEQDATEYAKNPPKSNAPESSPQNIDMNTIEITKDQKDKDNVQNPQSHQQMEKKIVESLHDNHSNNKDNAYGKNMFSTPAARARAKHLGIDIQDIIDKSSHKVYEADVLDYNNRNTAMHQSHQRTDGNAIIKSNLSNMQHIIGARMLESKQNAPHFYLNTSCCIDALLDLKKQFKAHNVSTTLTHWFIMITAKALAMYPKINSEFINHEVHQHTGSDIAIAMSIGEMLITPVIRNAQHKTIREIADEMRALTTKAQNNQLSPKDYQNGSFTISNVGMYGIDECISIINPPQVAIMAIGAGRDELYMDGDEIAQRKVVNINISVDHRVVNGAYACEFLQTIKKMIETPNVWLI